MDGPTIFALSAGMLLLLFCPISVTAYMHLDGRSRKLQFAARLYNSLLLAGGYSEARAEGIAVHLSRKKALILPYGQMLKARPDFNKLRGFHIREIGAVAETGTSTAGILLAAVLLTAGSAVGKIFRAKGRAYRCDVLLSSAHHLSFAAQIKIAFDLMTVLVLVVKLALEALIVWIEHKKSTT